MRVAFLSPCWPHDRLPNGIASYVSSIRNGLESLGVQVRILTSEMNEDEPDPHVSCVPQSLKERPIGVRIVQRAAGMLSKYLGMQQTLGYKIGVVLSRLDERSPIDLFEVEETFGIGAVVQRHFKKPVVVRLHGPWCVVGPELGWRRDSEFWIRCMAEYHAIRKASAISSPSKDALDRVRTFYRLPLPNARVIPNPAPVVLDQNIWKSKTCDANVVLFVGRFDRVKGADILLQAFAEVAMARPSVRLIFSGPDVGLIQGTRTVGLEEYLMENIPSAVHGQIQFNGTQTNQQIAKQRRQAAVTVISSRYENFPMVILEAMAAGSPIVASRTGGIKEIIRDGHNGLLYNAESPEDLARQIERLLADRELAARIGSAARVDATERYGPTTVAKQTTAFYEEVMERG